MKMKKLQKKFKGIKKLEVAERAEKEIKKLRNVLKQTYITPDSQTYIQIYDAVKSLYFSKEYALAEGISWLLRKELKKPEVEGIKRLAERAEKEIKKLRGVLEQNYIIPDSQTYIQIYDSVKSLYFSKEYMLAAGISWMLRMGLEK